MGTEDRPPQSPPTEATRSVLMADIVNSTSLYERLGDARARELISGGLEAMAGSVAGHGGHLVKSLGDGILACFENGRATAAALEICDQVAALMLQARVGVHCGPVIDDGGDIFGDTVNTAARLAAVARPSEVLVSKTIWADLPAEVRELGRSLPSIAVKGKRKPLEVFSFFNQSCDYAETFLQAPTPTVQRGLPSSLELHFGSERYRLEGSGSFMIGRDPTCDLRIDHERTSRVHARVFYRSPDFLLEDSSTNGTTVVPDGGVQVLIRRRETVLFGRGKIYPGATPDTSDDAAGITFLVR